MLHFSPATIGTCPRPIRRTTHAPATAASKRARGGLERPHRPRRALRRPAACRLERAHQVRPRQGARHRAGPQPGHLHRRSAGVGHRPAAAGRLALHGRFAADPPRLLHRAGRRLQARGPRPHLSGHARLRAAAGGDGQPGLHRRGISATAWAGVALSAWAWSRWACRPRPCASSDEAQRRQGAGLRTGQCGHHRPLHGHRRPRRAHLGRCAGLRRHAVPVRRHSVPAAGAVAPARPAPRCPELHGGAMEARR